MSGAIGRWPCDTYGGKSACGGSSSPAPPSGSPIFIDLTGQIDGIKDTFIVPAHSFIQVFRNGTLEYPPDLSFPLATQVKLPAPVLLIETLWAYYYP